MQLYRFCRTLNAKLQQPERSSSCSAASPLMPSGSVVKLLQFERSRFWRARWISISTDSSAATEKAEIMEIVDDLDVTGGIRSIRAKAKLVKAGYPGLFGILEALQKLDYRQASDAAFGFELNKALEDITGGLNARYAAVQADEQLHPAKALWNTKTVKAWMATFAKWPDAAAFKKAKTARAKKKRG